MGDFFEELSAIVERSMQLYYSNSGLVWRTWTEEKEEIALKSNDEEEEIAGESDEVCAICLYKIDAENVMVLQCSHMFHSQCVAIWVAHKSSCPLCIRPIFILFYFYFFI
ncbi:hypothetical protein AMTRI_Chr06g176970 [Amborella trichopoda]